MGCSLLDHWTETETHGNFNLAEIKIRRWIVAIDEIWIRDFEPELKSQSNKWRATGFLSANNFCQAQSKIKQLMIFAYDHQRVIVTGESHVEKVSLECIIVLS